MKSRNRSERQGRGARNANKRNRVGQVLAGVEIESLDARGTGVGHSDGKVLFVEGALPGEIAEVRVLADRAKYAHGRAIQIDNPSDIRVQPRCRHFGACGGCRLQHIDHGAQLTQAQAGFRDTLTHVGKLDSLPDPGCISGQSWHYRRRARLKIGRDESGSFAGYRLQGQRRAIRIEECPILDSELEQQLPDIQSLVQQFDSELKLDEINLIAADNGIWVVASHLGDASRKVVDTLRDYSNGCGWHLWLRRKGRMAQPVDTEPVQDGATLPRYSLPDWDLEIQFHPDDFIQGNSQLNQLLVNRAMDLLEPQAGQRVLDLFCGVGNFTLPIARAGAEVIGIESVAAQLERAEENAAINVMGEKISWKQADLFVPPGRLSLTELQAESWLLDPPRDGAMSVCESLVGKVRSRRIAAPQRIVYVSCNPATLARDLATLVRAGYRLACTDFADMFPHTGHAESISLLLREN